MTANNGSDSDLIFSLGMVFAAGRAQLLMAAGRPPQPHRAQQSCSSRAPGLLGCGELPAAVTGRKLLFGIFRKRQNAVQPAEESICWEATKDFM